MPPKKSTSSSSKPATGKAVNRSKAPAKSSQQKKPTTKSLSKSSGKSPSKSKVKVPSITKEDKAATKIQCLARTYLAKRQLQVLRKKKSDYDELIEKLQKQAWLEIVQRQREEDEKERKKEEEERKRRREELKWKKDLLDAAFDGELDTIKNIMKQVEVRCQTLSKFEGAQLQKFIVQFKMSILHSSDANDNSTLSEACAGGDEDTIKYLIENNAVINSLGQFHRTPLYRAAFAGHLNVVKLLLENGGDPRIQDKDGVSPAEIASAIEIKELLSEWDITKTEALLQKYNEESEKVRQEEEQYHKEQQERILGNLTELEKEYDSKQKLLQRAYQELNKRIFEHDKCTAEGFERTDVTLKAIEAAEEDLLKAQKEEADCRERLMECRLKLREESEKAGEDDVNCVKCNIKELNEVLVRDVGDKIKNSGKWPLLMDPNNQGVTFLRYRDTNYLNTLSLKDMEPETLRMALLGAIRFGKTFVLDMMEVDMLAFLHHRMDEIQNNLFQTVIDKSILHRDKYLSLVRSTDGKEYKKENFNDFRVQKFGFVLVTKIWNVPDEWKDMFYTIKIVTPSMT